MGPGTTASRPRPASWIIFSLTASPGRRSSREWRAFGWVTTSRRPRHDALSIFTHGVSGATVFKGVAGFGVDHHLHSASFVELSDKLPVKIEFVETPEKVDELMPRLMELSGTGMIDVLETMIVK